MKYFAGIDPGVNGAIVVLSEEGKLLEVFMIPKIGSTTEVDKKAFVEIFSDFYSKYGGDMKHVVMENVHAIFGSSAAATFTFGGIVWSEEILLLVYSLPYTLVSPKDWQKEMWQGITPLRKPGKKDEKTGKIKEGSILTKETTEVAVQRLFPNVNLVDPTKPRSKKIHDGIADALLLAEYGRRKFN
jgi:hypothetical protein